MILANLKKAIKWLFFAMGIFTFCALMAIGGCTTILLTAASQNKGGDGHASSIAMDGVSLSAGSGDGVATFGISCKGWQCQASQFGLFSSPKK